MATKYTLQNLESGTPVDVKEFSKKQTAITAGEKDSMFFQVVTSSGTVVHEADNRPAVEPTPAEAPDETLTEKQKRASRLAESDANREFPGNYSIAMAPFAQELAKAFGGIETEVENIPGSLTRRVHFYGPNKAIDAFLKVLDTQAEKVLKDLKVWQKENIEKRRGLTDMQKYLGHREFIAKQAKVVAKHIKAGDLG